MELSDSFLIKTALICTIIGLVSLYFISGHIDISEANINTLNNADVDKTVVVKGKVISVQGNGNMSIITIEKPERIKVVIFENVTVEKGKTIEARGRVEEYKGSYEIIADEIKVK